MSSSGLPTPEQERELHRRLVVRDKTAQFDLAETYYEPLIRFLRREFPEAIDDAIADAVSQTWMDLCKKPESHDGDRSLWSFLCLSAKRDLINALNKEHRRKRRISAEESVEELAINGTIRETDESENVLRIQNDILPKVKEGLTDEENDCLSIYLDGERRTWKFAAALKIDDRPKAEQASVVKRLKDKLKARIKRVRGES